MKLSLSLVVLSICPSIGAAAPAPQKITEGPPAVQTSGGAPAHADVDQMERGHAVHPPDAEHYQPLRLPAPRPERHDPKTPDLPTSYDIAEGRESLSPAGTRLRLQKALEIVQGSGGPAGHSEEDLTRGENFTSLLKVGAYTSWPYRANCKVFMTFPNNTSWVGSATLVDPSHAITVGHVVHDSKLGGWAKSLYIVPSYNGDAGAIREPYGRAYAASLHSWTAWTRSRDQSKDVGFIDLSRPVGGITGWYGFGSSTNCGWFTTTQWFHSSYPSDSPHNGQRMYVQAGDFDSCPTSSEARFHRRSYGGESGSGHYKFYKGGRVVWAMLSHGTNSRTDACRLDSGRVGHVKTWISQDRPAKFDITPLYTRGPSAVARGKRLTGLSFLLHNYSKQKVTSRFSFNIYLSRNDFISTGDIKLGGWSVGRTLNPNGSTRVTWGTGSHPLVPHTVPEGTYYVGVLMTSRDGNGRRRTSGKYDVHKVVVSQARPSLKQPVINRRFNVTTRSFYITGDNLGNTRQFNFGSTVITSQNPANWHAGYFTKIGNTVLRVYPPQGKQPGPYTCRALSFGHGSYSNTIRLELLRNGGRTLAGPGTVKVGTTTRLYASGGTGISRNTLIQLTFSWSTTPTVARGFVSLGIGDNWRQLYFGRVNTVHPITGLSSWALGSKPAGYAVLKGRRVYFQCIQADLGRPATVFPLKTTNETSVLYQ